ncbi:MAG: radical SAM protein [Myxococcales bacterium]|nr:radical SAM protein [Myxococcales bacterium]MCB9530234.1 radical SAM protein [Myxococcales bacterium]MCB9533747.1 radical SAM protein [Myxococcales bacterium]
MEAVDARDGARAWLVARAQQLVVPIGVHIDVTYRCDLDCVHCYLADRKRAELSLEEYEELFDELRALGTLFLLVSGGEIFHRPDGLEILRAARKRRFELRIITHGGHIDAPLAAQLAELGIAVVAMSIYSADAGEHDAITKVPGSWERTVGAARHLHAVGVPVLFKCVLMTGNRGVARSLSALADSVGAKVEFSVDMKGDNKGSDELMGLGVDLQERLAVFDCVYPQLVDADALPAFSPDDHTCLAGNASCYISPDGTVQPCLDWEEPAGNVRDASFSEIWLDSPVFRRARTIRRSSFSNCQPCENVSNCGLCPARAHRETGSTTGSAPSKCRETTAMALGFAARDENSGAG